MSRWRDINPDNIVELLGHGYWNSPTHAGAEFRAPVSGFADADLSWQKQGGAYPPLTRNATDRNFYE